jgi:5-methylcytosine-specific restriction protein A
VNRHERNPEARRVCVAHHGTNCAACGFSFEATYGDIGRDFIHVHHLVPVSEVGMDYKVDPLTDLVPLCPNCHAMAHIGTGSPRTPAELRAIMADNGFHRGDVLSAWQLEAQRDARAILAEHTQDAGI